MENIVSNIFEDSFILNNRVEVKDLIEGAKQFGGATQIGNCIYSNIDTNEPIQLKEDNANTYGILVPTTLDISTIIDNTEYVELMKHKISFIANDIKVINSSGSWYSDELQDIVIENSNIVSFTTDMKTEIVLHYMRLLALHLKEIMAQEGISIFINDGLVIV